MRHFMLSTPALCFVCLLQLILPTEIAWADPLPRACMHPNQEDIANEGLPRNEAVIVYDYPKFEYQGSEYPVDTFSDKDKHPHRESTMCFRYEVENVGSGDIERFKWKAAKILVHHYAQVPMSVAQMFETSRLLVIHSVPVRLKPTPTTSRVRPCLSFECTANI